MRFVFTCAAPHGKLTLYEWARADGSFRFLRWLSDGVGLAETELSPGALAQCVWDTPVIFLRHIFAVTSVLPGNAEAPEMLSSALPFLDPENTVSVQVRGIEEGRSGAVAASLSALLTAKGFRLDPAAGRQILSVYLAEGETFLGVGDAAENLTHRNGGMAHFSREEAFGFVSRAEFKLLEAAECFRLSFENVRRAADLGAAPGGWTKVLASRVPSVTAIDPSRLNPAVLRLPNVEYRQMRAEEYLKSSEAGTFDLVVNDMKLDVKQSVRVMNGFHARLTENALALMTFKLPHSFSYRDILDGLRALNGYALVTARQLFHNRSEITVLLRRTLQNPRLMAEKEKPASPPRCGLSKKLAKKYRTK